MKIEINKKVFDVGFIADACVAISDGKVVEYFFVDNWDDDDAIQNMVSRIQLKYGSVEAKE